MIKKTKRLVWTIFIIFVAACDLNPSFDGASPSSIAIDECVLDVTIEGPENKSVMPGEKIEFRASKKSNSWAYLWSTNQPPLDINFSATQESETIFTVPNVAGTINIFLMVQTGSDCEERLTSTLEVEALQEAKAENTVEPTKTPIPSATSTQTTEPSVTPTPKPSPTAEPTETATLTPSPTSPPQPIATPIPQYNAPVITQVDFLPGGAVYVAWTWDGELSPTQNFAVRFWSESDPRPEAHFSITWTKELNYRFGVNNIDYPAGTYLINVAVMEGPSEGTHYAVVESSNEPVFVDDISPSPPPPAP